MSLSPGRSIGPYDVVSKIGAGGMGEVYRATDVRLKRSVAMKVLPPAFASDADRMERMRREAQVLAQLNHPNIAAIYGVEDHALVMELVEGEALRGPLPVETALPYARQIADALEHAHEKGIIHRDLKPANIKITPDGVVKVLDFGLAKMVDDSVVQADAANSPTLTMRATEAGMILGTAAYMAPEQARGAAVDRRADIWAFGVVLYEMLAGRQLFAGETVSDTLAGVLKSDIEFGSLPPDTPPAIRALLQRCLERDKKKRLQAIGEARIVIDDVLSGGPASAAQLSVASVPPPALQRRWVAATALLTILLAGSLVVTVNHMREAPPVAPVVEFDIEHPAALGMSRPWDGPVISPDGRHVALPGPGGLFLRALGARAAVALDTGAPANLPFWSSDSRHVAYLRGDFRTLARIAVTGGSPQTIAQLPFEARGAIWAPDGSLVIAAQEGPLFRLPAGGGPPTPLTTLDRANGEIWHVPLSLLPDGRSFAFLAGATGAGESVRWGSLDSRDTRPLVDTAYDAKYAEDYGGEGYLLFGRSGELWAQRFDGRANRLSGEPARIATGLGTFSAAFSASRTGVLVTRVFQPQDTEPVWMDRAGRLLGVVGPAAGYSNPSLSPDERWLAVGRSGQATGTRDIWILDLVRQTTSRLTSDPGDELNPLWSPDGQWIIYSRSEPGSPVRDIYRKLASGVGPSELLSKGGGSKNVETVAPDGRSLLYNLDSREVLRLPLDGQARTEAVLTPPQANFNFDQSQLSPDGRWVAYRSNESGRHEVYVQSYPPGPRRWQISNAGGSEPQWRRDGRELYYVSNDQLMAVSMAARDGAIDAGVPTSLFSVELEPIIRRSRYLVAANGQRFLVLRRTQTAAPVRMTVTVNWTVPPGQ